MPSPAARAAAGLSLAASLLLLAASGAFAHPTTTTSSSSTTTTSTNTSTMLIDWQPAAPAALGVSSRPQFAWEVPPCPSHADQQQVAYRLTLRLDNGTVVCDSGTVTSADSVGVRLPASCPSLSLGTAYSASVVVTTGCGPAPPSPPATLITSLSTTTTGGGIITAFHPSATWIGLPSSVSASTTFAFLRLVMPAMKSPPARVIAHIHANIGSPLMLMGFKLYVDGQLALVGPGRGETAPNGTFLAAPYVTADLTAFFAPDATASPQLLAIELMSFDVPAVLAQIDLFAADGSLAKRVVTDAASGWRVLAADDFRNPTAPTQHSAGNARMEFIDARREPVGWRNDSAFDDSGWAKAAPVASYAPFGSLAPRLAGLPVEVLPGLRTPSLVRPLSPNATGPVTCGQTPENGPDLVLGGCGDGVIHQVVFAAWGLPTGSCPSGFRADPKCNANNTQALVEKACVGQKTCTLKPSRNIFGDPCYDVVKRLAVQVACSAPAPPPPPSPAPRAFFIDFGKEFQGGLVLDVPAGRAGQQVMLTTGELCSPMPSCTQVEQTWGWSLTWTLRDGPQRLEQHQYQEFRYAVVEFLGSDAPANFTLGAWTVQLPYNPADSAFASQSAALNTVWELNRYTLQAAVLDTYTDSNTRERRPYEADGLIAATARLLLQRNSVMWARHSHHWILTYPTWPVEWLQQTPLLALQDFFTTGETGMAEAFFPLLYKNTQIGFLDPATGLLRTDKMGRHIIGWDPAPARDMWTDSPYQVVGNVYGVYGLSTLARMLAPSNQTLAAQLNAQAARLQAAVMANMWNAANASFCDGRCADVHNHSGIYAAMYPLAFGLVPESAQAKVWRDLAAFGLERIGDYGAYFFLHALNAYAQDDGAANLHALTKRDEYSWLNEIAQFNATMTRESWTSGTMSHAWGTAAIPGIVHGVLGLNQTTPTYATFTVKPRLAGVGWVSAKIPTVRGPIVINASANGSLLAVSVPCSSRARLCVQPPRGAGGARLAGGALLLDGRMAPADYQQQHVCLVDEVGCGAGGAPRMVQWVGGEGDAGAEPQPFVKSPPGPVSAWRLLPDFSDEFEGSVINSTRWTTTPPSWGQWSWRAENAQVEGGLLGLTMAYSPHLRDGQHINYTSGILKSTAPQGVYTGFFEARIRGAARFPGVCPAFWAWRSAAGYWTELDFVEMTEDEDNVHDIDFTSHVFPPTPGVSKELSNSTHKTFPFDPRSDFHVYGHEWGTDGLRWFVDGVLVKSMPAAPYFNRGWPMDIALSFGLRPPLRAMANATAFPTTFHADYVRVWQKVDE